MTALLRRLGTGRDYRDPLAAVDWSAADPEKPWLPQDLTPLPGLPAGRAVAFSRLEFARMAATGIWLEGMLIHLASRGGFLGRSADETRLVLQEVREEAGHSLLFLEVVAHAGLAGVPLLGPTRLLDAVACRLPADGAAFWAVVYLGESVTDAFAVRAMRAGDALCPVARGILAQHHRDEARHIAAARALLAARLESLSPLQRRAFAVLLPPLLRRFLAVAFYPTAASLAALGLDPGAAAAARADPARRAIAEGCCAAALDGLRRAGIPLRP